jgi:hypothetical protein
MTNLLARVSPRERKVIGERPRDALQPLKGQGKCAGQARVARHPGAEAVLPLMRPSRAASQCDEAIAGNVMRRGFPPPLGAAEDAAQDHAEA